MPIRRDGDYRAIAVECATAEVLLNCVDAESEQRMAAEVDNVLKTGDSVGGVFEVRAHKVPAGLGTYANWDERLQRWVFTQGWSRKLQGPAIEDYGTFEVATFPQTNEPPGYFKKEVKQNINFRG